MSETGTGSETEYVLSAESHALLVKRIAELERQLEAEDRVHTAAMKYFQEVGDKAEELRRHRRLLRAVAKAAEWVWDGQNFECPCCNNREDEGHDDTCEYKAAIDAGALEGE